MSPCEVFSCTTGCAVAVCANAGAVARRAAPPSASNRRFIAILRLGGKEGRAAYCDGATYGAASAPDGPLNWNVGDIGSVVVLTFAAARSV